MNNLLGAIWHHGYLLVFLFVLAEACGLPAPAALALVAAGAASAAHILSAPAAIAFAVLAMILGDTLLFFLGRYMGWALLSVLCRLSLNPETCILRSAEAFYKRGKLTLLFAKFVPGINTMAPPLAGSMKMKLGQFIRLDVAGAFLYAATYTVVGYLFRDFVVKITRGIQNASHILAEVFLLSLLLFIGYRIVQYRRYRISDIVPRIAVTELAHRMLTDEKDIVVVDVRSHGYYEAGAARIAGSIRLEPNRLSEEFKNFPKDKDIYVYCT
ncbi:MAG TPA: VTT domain-containing protein [Terriglobales bacterium]|jgi:membrane protein DedA with SNARE-associated domain|nr:VTT domain-containing protein [Terriglobales bacterium]